MKNNPLKYSNCWEDAFLLEKFLDLNEGSKVISIASAGDNSLYLLKNNPAEIVLVDTNPIQIHLCKLKEKAICHLEYEEVLKLLGFQECNDRWSIFSKMEEYLDADTQLFFENNVELLNSGIIHQGKFEQFFQLFSQKILPWIHSPKTISKLFEIKSQNAQEQFYLRTWNSLLWRLFLKLSFSKFVMARFSRDKEKLKEVTVNVGEVIYEKSASHLKSTSCQSNYMLQYALYGNYKSRLPPYMMEGNFHKIKAWLQTNSISYFEGYLDKALDIYPDFDRFNLSNIFEYMSKEAFEKQVQILVKKSNASSTFCYWNLFVDRNMNQDNRIHNVTINDIDLGFFYSTFISSIKQ